MTGALGLRIGSYAALGSLIGAGYFAALAWNVRLYVCGADVLQGVLIHLLRLAAAVAAFTLCARQGAAPMLASFVGFLAIRTITIHRYWRYWRYGRYGRYGSDGLAAEQIP
jgi:F1F0 ATPase subunit 2